MEKGKHSTEDITKRLDVVIALLVTIASKDGNDSIRERIIMLYSFGLRPSEIAPILGKTASHVSKELSLAKKER